MSKQFGWIRSVGTSRSRRRATRAAMVTVAMVAATVVYAQPAHAAYRPTHTLGNFTTP